MKNKYPEIRLSGYDTEWSMKKLGDITDIKDSSRISNALWISNGVPYLRSSDLSNDNIKGELFLSKKTYKEYSAKTGAPTRGDLLFTSGGKIGVTYYKENDDELYVQGGSILYAKTSESEHLDGRFLKTYFDTPILKKYIENASTGLTIKHFTLKPAKDTPIAIPGLDEQKKIGLFFKDLDDTISLHQQELDALKQTKQGFLQKMFPKNGETAPKIRFEGHNNEWILRELKDVATFINGRAYKQTELLESGKYKVLRVGNFYTNNSWYYSDLELDEKYYADFGDLLYTWSASFGPHIWKGDKVIYHYHIWKVDLKDGYDKNFIVQLFEYDKAKIMSDKNGSTMVHITKKGMEEKKIYIPSYNEQVKIGKFFRELDEVINLKEQELEALKQTKKGFLQKMFV